MPEVEDECTFEIGADQLSFRTRTNGDELNITGIDFDQGQAASMAWLVNSPDRLEIKIKIAGGP